MLPITVQSALWSEVDQPSPLCAAEEWRNYSTLVIGSSWRKRKISNLHTFGAPSHQRSGPGTMLLPHLGLCAVSVSLTIFSLLALVYSSFYTDHDTNWACGRKIPTSTLAQRSPLASIRPLMNAILSQRMLWFLDNLLWWITSSSWHQAASSVLVAVNMEARCTMYKSDIILKIMLLAISTSSLSSAGEAVQAKRCFKQDMALQGTASIHYHMTTTLSPQLNSNKSFLTWTKVYCWVGWVPITQTSDRTCSWSCFWPCQGLNAPRQTWLA